MSDTDAAIQALTPKLEKQRCLIIADDLTGGADAGVQFAKRGLKTLLVSCRGEETVPLATRPAQDVLVINTITRGLPTPQAFDILSGLLKGFDPKRFPIIYKKIDSTLRGNIGSEIKAILRETALPLCFLAPSYPEQGRTLAGGIMMVGKKPLAGGSAVFRTFTERLAGDGDVVTQATINANTVIPAKAGIQNRAGCRIKACPGPDPGSGMTTFDMLPYRSNNVPIHQRITGVMADVALEALREARVDTGDLALILTGGDTALGVLQLLDYQGIELEGELLAGIVRGNLRGGPWDGLTVVTKAGAFGKEDALVRILERLIVPAQAGYGEGITKPAETTVDKIGQIA